MEDEIETNALDQSLRLADLQMEILKLETALNMTVSHWAEMKSGHGEFANKTLTVLASLMKPSIVSAHAYLRRHQRRLRLSERLRVSRITCHTETSSSSAVSGRRITRRCDDRFERRESRTITEEAS